MNGRNEKFRQSLKRVDASSKLMYGSLVHVHVSVCLGEEAGKLETLEGQWRAALNKQRHKKKQVQQLEDDMQVMTIAL